MRTTADPCGNEAGLVQRYVGTAYDKVRLVADNLEAILGVHLNLEQLLAIFAELDDLVPLEEQIQELQAIVDALQAGEVTWGEIQNIPNSTITLTGDVSGSGTMTALGSVSINATIADDSHNHLITNVDGLQDALDDLAPLVHSHLIADVTGLQAALDGKSAVGHTHTLAQISNLGTLTLAWTSITGKPSTFPPDAHTHIIGEITGLSTILVGHDDDISALYAALADKADLSHTHDWADITGEPATYAPSAHTHPASEISDSTAAGRALLTAADAAAQQTALSLVPGTNVQAYSAKLAAWAGLTWAADKIVYLTGASTLATLDFLSWARTFLSAADAAGGRTALGLGTAATADKQTSKDDTTSGHLQIVGAFGWGETSSPPTVADVDATDIASGLWATTNAGTAGTLPVAGVNGTLLATRRNATISAQRWRANGSADVYERYYNAGWSTWRRVLRSDDIGATLAPLSGVGTPWEMLIAVSDETTALTAGTAKVTFRIPRAVTLTAVRASVKTAPTGSTLIVDINEEGVSVLGTKLSIDASEKTSTTAASAATITDASLADDAEMTIDIDQVGSTVAGAGLKVLLKGTIA